VPVATEIAHAAAGFAQNAGMLDKSFAGLSTADWEARPSEHCNSMLWVAGHIVWARSRALGFLGVSWSRPWLGQYARGKFAEAGEPPSTDELLSAWTDVKSALTAALEEASAEKLASASPDQAPTFDGTIAGTVGFMAFHETYHVGQAAYLRKWLGYGKKPNKQDSAA
jgi:uncharacterized damage-inducible protein DinB